MVHENVATESTTSWQRVGRDVDGSLEARQDRESWREDGAGYDLQRTLQERKQCVEEEI